MDNQEKISNIKYVNELDKYYEKVEVYKDCELITEELKAGISITKIPDYVKYIIHKQAKYRLGIIDGTDELVFYSKLPFDKENYILAFDEVSDDDYKELQEFSMKLADLESSSVSEMMLGIVGSVAVALGIILIFFIYYLAIPIIVGGFLYLGVSKVLNNQSKIIMALRKSNRR